MWSNFFCRHLRYLEQLIVFCWFFYSPNVLGSVPEFWAFSSLINNICVAIKVVYFRPSLNLHGQDDIFCWKFEKSIKKKKVIDDRLRRIIYFSLKKYANRFPGLNKILQWQRHEEFVFFFFFPCKFQWASWLYRRFTIWIHLFIFLNLWYDCSVWLIGALFFIFWYFGRIWGLIYVSTDVDCSAAIAFKFPDVNSLVMYLLFRLLLQLAVSY